MRVSDVAAVASKGQTRFDGVPQGSSAGNTVQAPRMLAPRLFFNVSYGVRRAAFGRSSSRRLLRETGIAMRSGENRFFVCSTAPHSNAFDETTESCCRHHGSRTGICSFHRVHPTGYADAGEAGGMRLNNEVSRAGRAA